MLSFDRTEKTVFGAQRTARNEEDKTFSLGRRADSFVVGLLPGQLARPERTVNAPYLTFIKVSFRTTTAEPWAAKTAASFMGSGVSESHERSIKFRRRHSGVSSAVEELLRRSSPD